MKHKLLTSDDVDRIISAEIPDIKENKNLHEIVVRHMIHGPYGTFCLDKSGQCSKHFPKPFQHFTEMNKGGYPLFKRRETIRVQKNTRFIDNIDVVPYNAYLLQKYNAHINVEACVTVKSIKYIFKYIHKGYDCATIELKQDNQTLLKYDENEI